MSSPSNLAGPTIAGHAFALQERVGDILSLRIALDGAAVADLAGALAKLAGVRVTERAEAAGRARSYLVHCLGFQMVLSTPAGESADCALAVATRVPQAALGVMSDLGGILEHLMSEPARVSEDQPTATRTSPTSTLRRSGLQPGKPLARRTELRRKTPLARGRFPLKPNN